MTQLSNVPMQPKPDAVERSLTLVERIQPILDNLMMECFKHGFHQSEMTEAEFIDYSRKNCVPPKREIIGILEQHQAESVWVSVDERLPEREYCEYLVWVGYPDIATYSKFGWELPSDAVVTHWMPLPKPPSEVQDD